MGSCSLTSDPRDQEVQDELNEAKLKEELVLKLLLLGAGGSGKSTFFKQLTNTYGNGFSNAEKMNYTIEIYRQIVENMQLLINQSELIRNGSIASDDVDEEELKNIGIDPKEKHLYIIEDSFQSAATYILRYPDYTVLDETAVKQIDYLWKNCKAVRKVYEHRNKLAIADSTEYFFKEIHRIGAKDYVPSTEDVVLVRYRTTGMTEKVFQINQTRMKVVDVGGQRNERKKWIHCFGDVNAVIFVVSLTCYDEVPFEEVIDLDVDVVEKNNMIESIEVFEHTLRYEFFKNTCFILFFNKSDLFEEKIKHSPITQAFPEFEQNTTDFRQCVDYIRQQYLDKAQGNSNRSLFTHITCATDQKNVKRVFDDVQISLVNTNLSNVDLV